MKVKIDGIGLTNKGAQLMAFAIIDRLKRQYPDAVFVFGRHTFQSLEYFTEKYDDLFLQTSLSARIKNKLLKMLRIDARDLIYYTLPKDIDVVLDAGGYQYGDPWNHTDKSVNWIRRYYEKLKGNGARVVLLPQAFGPFQKETSKKMIRTSAHYADLMFPRDNLSLEHLQGVFGTDRQFEIYGDFTNLLKPTKTGNAGSGTICLIPNKKMITSSNGLSEAEYLSFFEQMISHIVDKSGSEIVLLNHEGAGDLALCQKINARFNNRFALHTGLNALQIKEVLAGCLFVVSSRYHGIISALSQRIPCLATSWSHKYEELYREFELPGLLLDIKNQQQTEKMIDKLLDATGNRQMRNHLKIKNEYFANRTEEMWQKVFAVIEK